MMLEHFVKTPNGSWMLTDFIKGADAVRIETIGFETRLDAFYRGVVFEENEKMAGS